MMSEVLLPIKRNRDGEVIVRELCGDATLISRLAGVGITMRAEIGILQNRPHGPLLVKVRGVRLALGRGEAAKIIVETIDGSVATS